MAYRELELTLLSARDLKNVNLFTRMDVYAVASISGDPMTRQCTPTDTSGGRNPSWNATFRFSVPPSAAAAAGGGNGWLHVLLRSQRALGDRDVGEVVVPLAELLTSADGPGPQPPRLASYQVHTVHRGEPRGVLNVSYRLGPVVAPVAERADDKPPVFAYPVPSQSPNPAPPQQPFKHQNQAPPSQPFQPQYPVAPQQQPFKPQNPAPPQPYQYYPQSDYYAPPPQPYNLPHDAYAPPWRPRYEEAEEEALSPANGKKNGYGPTNYYMGPHTQIILGGGGGGAPTPPQTNNTVQARTNDGPKPKPSYTWPNASPAKTDYSWPKASPQQQDTPTWPNASAKKPDRPTQPTISPAETDYSWRKASPQHQDTPTWPNTSAKKPERPTQPTISPAKTDYSWTKTSPQHQDASPKKPERPTRPQQHETKVAEAALTQPITSLGKTDHSWPKTSAQQHQETGTWPNASPKKPERSTRHQHDTKVAGAGEQLVRTQTQIKIDTGKTDNSATPQALQEQNIQPGKAEADATRPKLALANTRSNSTPGKADHQPVLQYERVHSLPTATAR